MGSNINNKNLPNSHDLKKLFSELGYDSTLAQIKRYVWFYLNYLAPNKFRDAAAKEINSALKDGRLNNLSLFSFVFYYADEIKNSANRFDYA